MRQLVALRREDGTVAWRGDVTQGCQRLFTASGRVFCPGGSFFAFDAATGRSIWTYPTDSTLSLVEGTANENLAFAGSLTSVYSFDAATGSPLWKRSFSGNGWLRTRMRSLTLAPDGSLLVALDAEFTPNGSRTAAAIIAVDPETGAERWRYQDGDATSFRKVGSLTLWNGLILYSDSVGQEIVAVDAATRQVRWRVPWTPGFLGSLRAPTVVDGVAYWAAGDEQIYAADAATGQRRWTVKPDRGSYVNHEVCGSVVVGDNTALTVVERATGASRGVLFDGELVGQMATADGELYVATERGVYSFACD